MCSQCIGLILQDMASKTKRDAELDAAEQDRRSTLEVIVVPL